MNENTQTGDSEKRIFQSILRIDRYEHLRNDARYLAKFVLVLLAGGVVLTSALVAPNGTAGLLKLFKDLDIQAWRRGRILNRLKRKRYITVKRRNGQFELALTRNGRKVARSASLDILEIKRPVRWDQRWRIVVFDIPERKREARDILRAKLKQLNFCLIQKSVWVLPWPCREEIEFIRELYLLDDYLTFWEVPDAFDFYHVRKIFNL